MRFLRNNAFFLNSAYGTSLALFAFLYASRLLFYLRLAERMLFLGKTTPLFHIRKRNILFPLSFFSAGGGFYFRYLSEFVTASAAAISQRVARRKDGCYTRRYHNGYKNKNCSTVHFILINPLYSVSFTHSVNNKKARLRSRRFANFFFRRTSAKTFAAFALYSGRRLVGAFRTSCRVFLSARVGSNRLAPLAC